MLSKISSIHIGIVSFLAAVTLRSFVYVPQEVLWLILVIAFGIAAVYFFYREQLLLLVLVGVLAALIGLARYEMVEEVSVVDEYQTVFDTKQTFKGRVISEPDVRENNARYVVEISAEDVGREIKTIVYVPQYTYLEYGEVISIRGTLQRVENFTEEFDWQAFLSKDEVYALMFTPEIERRGEFEGGLITRSLFSLKRTLLLSLSRILPEPHAALAGGLVFGGKRSLPREVLDDFRVAGLVHIVVLSGYNITIIAVALMAALSSLSLRTRLILGALAMIAFGVMVGGGPTVIRSVLMALIALWARAVGREYQVNRALIAALVAMVIISPKALVFDVGFQLSFIATAGLIYGVRLIEPLLIRIPTWGGIREIVATTTAAQIAVLPLLMYTVGEISLVSLPVNILVLPVVPLTMASVVITAILALLGRWLALVPAAIGYVTLAYIFFVVSVAVKIPHASVAIPQIPFIVVVVLYIGLVFLVRRVQLGHETP